MTIINASPPAALANRNIRPDALGDPTNEVSENVGGIAADVLLNIDDSSPEVFINTNVEGPSSSYNSHIAFGLLALIWLRSERLNSSCHQSILLFQP